MDALSLTASRPQVFVGCSSGGLHVASTLRAGLIDAADVTRWCEGEPAPSARAFDAAIFVLCHHPAPAFLLRLGVFLGVLGRERIFVCPAFDAVELPVEVADLTVASHPGAVREHLQRLAHPAEDGSPVAWRRKRCLGTARSAHPEQTLRIADISMSGALLETYGELPEHLVLDLELSLEDGEHCRVTADVVRIQYPQWGRVGGVGVRFVRFEDGGQAVLARYLETARLSERTSA